MVTSPQGAKAGIHKLYMPMDFTPWKINGWVPCPHGGLVQIMFLSKWLISIPSLKLTALPLSHEGWLEDLTYVSFWGKRPNFQVRLLLVLGRVKSINPNGKGEWIGM